MTEELDELADAVWNDIEGSRLVGAWRHLRVFRETHDNEAREQEATDLGGDHGIESRILDDYAGRYPIELLQNAQDASAEDGLKNATAWMHVSDTALLVGNQGKPFDEERLKGLLNLAVGSKRAADTDHHTIGYKGIGFTSVFEITDRPQIFSTHYEFCLDEQRARAVAEKVLGAELPGVPRRRFAFPIDVDDVGDDRATVEALRRDGAVTVIRLPLTRDGFRDPAEIRAYIGSVLAPEVLLFMPSLKRLVLSGNGPVREWQVNRGKKRGGGQLYTVADGGGLRESWLMFEDRTALPTDIAEKLEQDVWKAAKSVGAAVAVPWERGRPDPTRGARPLHVFFPTNDTTGRALLIHGDFYVHMDRTRIHTAGSGGAVTELVAGLVADLVERLALSLSDTGLPLLQCLMPQSEQASGFGHRLNLLIDAQLREASFLRTAGGTTEEPPALYQIGPATTAKDAVLLATCTDDPGSFLCGEDGSDPTVSVWLQALGVDLADSDTTLNGFQPGRADATYEGVLGALERYCGEQRVSAYGLRDKQVVQGDDEQWTRPTAVARRVPGVPPLPTAAAAAVVRLPRSKDARAFLDRCNVRDLDAAESARAVVRVASGSLSSDVATDLLRYLHRLWRSNKEDLESVVAWSVRVPCRSARGISAEWVPASSAYLSRAWTGDASLEQLYGSLKKKEFLVDDPLGDGTQPRAFFAWLGLASAPRTNPQHRERQLPWQLNTDDWGKAVRIREADPCQTHPETQREVITPWADRFDELISTETSRTGRAYVARFLGENASLLGDASVRCAGSGHSGRSKPGRVEGRIAWAVRTTAWLPAIDADGARVDLPPEEVWIEPPPSLRSHVLPIAEVAQSHAAAIGCGDPRRPAVDVLVAGLRRIQDLYPALADADDSVLATADWLFGRLNPALRNRRERSIDVPVPAWSSEGRCWSVRPLIADVDGIERLPGIDWLPAAGPATARILGLEPASSVVSPRAIPAGDVRRNAFFSDERRYELFALLSEESSDLGRLGSRLARLDEISSQFLDVELTHGERTVRASQSAFLEPIVDARGALRGGVLYLAARWIDDPRSAADRLVKYLDEPDLGDRILHFLSNVDGALSLHRIDDDTIAAAARALRQYGRPRRTLDVPNATDAIAASGGVSEPSSDTKVVAVGPTSPVDPLSTPGDLSPAAADTDTDRTTETESTDRPGPEPSPERERKRRSEAKRRRTPATRTKKQRLVTVVPAPGTPASKSDRSTTEGRARSDKGGVAAVEAYERAAGRYAKGMDHGNKGYDLEVYLDEQFEGAVIRYIEVKSLAGSWSGDHVKVSKAQLAFANGPNRHETWLYVVEFAQSDSPVVHAIPRAGLRADSFYFDYGWAALSEDPKVDTEMVLETVLAEFLDEAAPLIGEVIRAGAPVPITIEEPIDDLPDFSDEWVVEAAWPAKQLAIVTDEDHDRDEYLDAQGWEVLHIDQCSVEVVVESLGLEPDEDEPEV